MTPKSTQQPEEVKAEKEIPVVRPKKVPKGQNVRRKKAMPRLRLDQNLI